MVLQVFNLLGHGRLGQEEALGRLREATSFSNGGKNPQVIKVN
ncbi:hypothetical protein hamaS1_16480 [Moorella sp. Hama-1]|nr:hypothetical protein hamaS1_16480 [Moorella sp. Hama-1]